MSALCLRSFLDFMILTMAAWMYILRSSSTAWWVASISCGVSFCTVPAIRNLVLLLLYLRLTEMVESGERLSVLMLSSLASSRDWTYLETRIMR